MKQEAVERIDSETQMLAQKIATLIRVEAQPENWREAANLTILQFGTYLHAAVLGVKA